MLSSLKGKTAWITGGKRIGLAVARALAEQGVNIVVSYRSSKKEAELAVKISQKTGVKALAVQAEASSRPDMERAVREVSKKFPRIDILVNMASVFESVPFEKVTEKEMADNINAHILGTLWPSQMIVPRMPKGGHIINVADRTSEGKIYKGYLPYVVTKGAVWSLTKALAVELAPKGIFVNAVAPGPILRPASDVSIKEWEQLRRASPIKNQISDADAVDQFALLVLYLSLINMSSGNLYPLDQGHNL